MLSLKKHSPINKTSDREHERETDYCIFLNSGWGSYLNCRGHWAFIRGRHELKRMSSFQIHSDKYIFIHILE